MCLLMSFLSVQYKANKEGTVVGVAVSKVAMLTHCQALTQACNYCEGEWRFTSHRMTIYVLHAVWTYVCSSRLGETLVNVLDFKKDMGLWHGVLTVSLSGGVHEPKTGWCARTRQKINDVQTEQYWITLKVVVRLFVLRL